MKKTVLLLILSFISITNLSAASQRETAINNWQEYLLGYEIDSDDELYYLIQEHDELVSNEQDTGYWDIIVTDSNDYIFADLNSNQSADLTTTVKRLRAMTVAYCTPNSNFYQNQQLLNDIEYGLTFFSQNQYNVSIDEYDNWWDFEIGVPLNVLDIIILLDGQLNEQLVADLLASIDKFIPDPAIDHNGNLSTGANLLDRTLAKTLRYIVSDDLDLAQLTAAKIDPAFEFVTSGDGFYADGGFIQHTTVPYTASYGSVLLSDVMKFELLAENTQLLEQSQAITSVPMIITNNFLPFLYDSQMLFSTRGRSVARSATGNSDARKILIASYVIANSINDSQFASEVESVVKYQIENDQVFTNYYDGLSLFEAQQVRHILNDSTIVGKKPQYASKYFNSVDLLNYYGDDYLVNLRLYSPRIATTEIGNGENKLGQMQGAGAIYIYNDEQDEFNSEFVATINPYNYPGTTTDYTYSKPDVSTNWGGQINSSDWAGGVNANEYVSASLIADLSNVTSSELAPHKSWFFFEDQFISLGAGISGSSELIETTVANTSLSSNEQQLLIDEQPIDAYNGVAQTAFLENEQSTTGVGYYFYDSPMVSAKKEQRTGDYADINDGREGEVTNDYATVLIDNSKTDNYAYSTLVNVEANELATYAQNPSITILENTTNAQVVYSQTEDTLMATIYTTYQHPQFKVMTPCTIIITNSSSLNPTIYVSDPSEKLKQIKIVVDSKFTNIETNDAVTLENGVLTFDVSENDGTSKSAQISAD